MMRTIRFLYVLAVCSSLVALPTQAAMYKWIDENGNTNYGDSVPPKYASKVTDRSARPGSVKWERAMAALDERPSAQELEKRQREAKALQEQKRKDTALLSTYANEAEIEAARERELQRSQETLKVVSAELAGSNSPEDRQRIDALINQSHREIAAINARFDAQKTRFRELAAQRAAQATAKPSVK